MKSLVLAALRGYRRYVSPALPTACRFVPTCSDYAMEAVERNGVIRGGAQAAWRFLRCNPLGGHGYDPVPCQAHEPAKLSESLEKSREVLEGVVAGGAPAR